MKINLLIKILYPKKVIENIKKKIALLGINNKANINTFFLFKTILIISIFFLSLFYLKYGYFLAPVLTVIVYFLYSFRY